MKKFIKNEHVLVFFGVITTLLCEFLFLIITFMPKALAKNNEVDEPIIEKVIYRKMISVNTLLHDLQEQITAKDLGELNFEYLTLRNGTYYIGLYQDIILFITPFAVNDINEDIVYQAGIIIDRDTHNYDLALTYYKSLILANNEFIYDIDYLVKEVVEHTDEAIDQNNGLILAQINNEYEINFVIERKYNT